MDEFVFWSASALARAIRARELSSVEVVEAHLRRIDAVNPTLNAVVHLDRDGVLAAARTADAELASGDVVGLLHGVPVTVKDNIDVAGLPCTGGTLGRAGVLAEQDATVVERLRAAGAIVLGKTNLPEMALAFVTDNLVYGRTNNPYDLARTPGGSSGGDGIHWPLELQASVAPDASRPKLYRVFWTQPSPSTAPRSTYGMHSATSHDSGYADALAADTIGAAMNPQPNATAAMSFMAIA